jgi:hypothetical protein
MPAITISGTEGYADEADAQFTDMHVLNQAVGAQRSARASWVRLAFRKAADR